MLKVFFMCASCEKRANLKRFDGFTMLMLGIFEMKSAFIGLWQFESDFKIKFQL